MRLALSILRILFAAFALTAASAATAQSGPSSSPLNARVDFNIPAQNLATALSAYASATGTQVLYEASLTVSRKSTEITGALVPDVALRTLLEGTGLSARRTDFDAITILSEPVRSGAKGAAVVPDAQFLGALQAGIRNSLCAEMQTRPGSYRMAVQLWITPLGTIERAALLNTTGNKQRDAMLISRLRGVSIEARPPLGMGQPLTMAITPRSAYEPNECGAP